MFEIATGEAGVIVFSGRLDAAQCAKAQAFLAKNAQPVTQAELDAIQTAIDALNVGAPAA